VPPPSGVACWGQTFVPRREAARSGGDRSKALDADATQTALCTYLSAILIGGLLLNAHDERIVTSGVVRIDRQRRSCA
jgi:hypothetical protein